MNKKALAIVLAATLAACGSDDDGVGNAGNTGGAGAGGTPGTTATDSTNFIVPTFQTGLAEIQLAQLALQRSTNDDVRRYA